MKHDAAHLWSLKLAPILLPVMLPVLLPLCGCFGGCKGGQSTDSVLSSVVNPSHTWRATILLRQYMVDGHFDGSPTTYVLMDRDEGGPNYDDGQKFKDSQLVLKTTHCGPLSLQWADESTLRVTCVQCGLALSDVKEHAQGVGALRVEYAEFPSQSSWEAPRR